MRSIMSRKTWLRTGAVLIAAATAAVWLSGIAGAAKKGDGGGQSPAEVTVAEAEAASFSTENHVLKKTAIVSDNGFAVVAGGYQPLHPAITISCPATKCTYEADQLEQVQGSTSGNRWAICTFIDGNAMSEPLCPFVDDDAGDGVYRTGTASQSQSSVPKGKHTLQTFIYSDNGIADASTKITYRVYAP
jgi:hypothetical protein